MTFKSILVPFLQKPTATAAFKMAAVIAKREKAHIVAMNMRQRPLPPQVVFYPLGGTFPIENDDAFKKAEDENAANLRQVFDDLCEEFGVGIADMETCTEDMGATASWRDVTGAVPGEIADIATSFDLSVAARPGEPTAPLQDEIVEELLFRSGRPVLVAPPEPPKERPARIAIAWNGSAEAAKAVAAARPLLAAAETVKLIAVHPPGVAGSATVDLAATLRLHGIESAQVEVEQESGQDATKVLKQEIADAKPDLLVMGAYSHNRWRELILGGFTRDMLAHAEIPLLMAH